MRSTWRFGQSPRAGYSSSPTGGNKADRVNFFFAEGAVWLSNEAVLVSALEKNCLAVLNEEGTIEGGRES